MPDEIDLLERMVAIPSVSGEEEAARRVRGGDRRGAGVSTSCATTLAVRVEVRGRAPGPRSPWSPISTSCRPGKGWTRDPFTPTVEGTRLYGRGSGDAKASVAAMLCAAKDLADAGGPARGRLLVSPRLR